MSQQGYHQPLLILAPRNSSIVAEISAEAGPALLASPPAHRFGKATHRWNTSPDKGQEILSWTDKEKWIMPNTIPNEDIQSQTPASMAESVTRHAQITAEVEYKILLCGIDTLDLGLYVTWGKNWESCLEFLDSMKVAAQRENGGLLLEMPSGRKFTFQAGGKQPNYRFHLVFPGYHLFIAKTAFPHKSPNVYVSLNSKTIWLEKLENVLEEIADNLEWVGGGSIHHVQPSRCDLSADILVPSGFTLDFIQSHKVTRSRKSKLYFDVDQIGSFYAGDKDAPIQLRIYNKSKEVIQNGTKNWFWELWGIDQSSEVTRVEFQLRRPALKPYGVNTIAELQAKMAGIWQDLTQNWFSLRLPDNDSTERRTAHPFWLEVQLCAPHFGPVMETKRDLKGSNTASVDWYLSHVDGCLASIAARRGIDNRQEALLEVTSMLSERSEIDFTAKTTKRAIALGLSGSCAQRQKFEERAAMMEYEGGLDRIEAEQSARETLDPPF
jgi:hypothetical protein